MAEGKMLRQIRGYEIVSSRNESNEKDSDEEQIIMHRKIKTLSFDKELCLHTILLYLCMDLLFQAT